MDDKLKRFDEDLIDVISDFIELLKDFNQRGGALREYIAYAHEPDHLCETCPCKTDNEDKCILITSQKLIEKWEKENG